MGRRRVLAGAMGLAVAGPLAAASPSRRSARVLRFAHLTDVHVQRARAAGEGFATCLHHAQALEDPPQLLIFGGDNVMNVDGDGHATAGEQLEVWRSTLRNECSLPFRTVVGNHDILRLDPVDGKKWAADAFALDKHYYAFDQAGWRFIALDSTSPEGGGYKGRLDDEQFEWLAATLAETPAATPVCVVSHIPIVAACAYFDGDNEKTGNWVVPGAWMHIDARRIKDLFLKHPNVKLCLSGHMHLVDAVDYLGVKYACNGAVSGGWWGGNYHEFGPGYAVVDLFADGSSAVEFKTYPWTPRD